MAAALLGGHAVPGQGTLSETSEREIIWGGDDSKGLVLFQGTVVSGATRDAGNTPTTVLRPGLLLGLINATNLFKQWDVTAVDGSQFVAGVLDKELLAQDFSATDADRVYRRVVRAPLQSAQLLILGAAFVGHATEYLARRMLWSAGCILDDDPMGYLTGMVERYRNATATTDVLTAAQNGQMVFLSNAASVTVTLPAIQPGLCFDLVRTADEELIVQSAAGDDIIVGNDLSADSVTITTAGQQIGQRVRIKSMYIGAGITPKWIIEFPVQPFGTGLTGGFAYSIAT